MEGELGIFSMVNFAEFLESLLKTLSPKCQTGDLARNNTDCSTCTGCQILACYGNTTTCSGQNITCDVYYPSNNDTCTSEYQDISTTCDACESCTYNASNPDSFFDDCSRCTLCNATQCNNNVTCDYCSDSQRCFNTDQWLVSFFLLLF